MTGYVYILVNESLKGLVKIGITSREPFARASELQTTGVPTPFTVAATIKVNDSRTVERQIHILLADHRVANGREFFKINLPDAVKVLYECCRNNLDQPLDTLINQNYLSDLTTGQNKDIDTILQFLIPGENYNPPRVEVELFALIKQKNPRAMVEMGRMIRGKLSRTGYGHVGDDKKANKLFEQSIALQYLDAMYERGITGWFYSDYLDSYFAKEMNKITRMSRILEIFSLAPGRNCLPRIFDVPISEQIMKVVENKIWAHYNLAAQQHRSFVWELQKIKPHLFKFEIRGPEIKPDFYGLRAFSSRSTYEAEIPIELENIEDSYRKSIRNLVFLYDYIGYLNSKGYEFKLDKHRHYMADAERQRLAIEINSVIKFV
ncbi:GIY-YIG nuclease family protein [Deinococcus sp. AJ005]|uniref:GIY-YIG nuclease family protein n=1 Tax=Deinococcus sp. AJ005 TaxID=2652443 RepID=UPI00125CC594|nr:GIY-YIG nuclease family protein [Deinococcus sp. AJ005]QFP77354.1 GIY-YIG nuclease family protein [Deinococcus sp. AJ005]